MNKSIHEPHKIFFETLGNKTRWEIVHHLLSGPKQAGNIAQELGYEQSMVSHNLRRLERCGFVTASSRGKVRIYRLNQKTIKPLLKLVDRHVDIFCKKISGSKG